MRMENLFCKSYRLETICIINSGTSYQQEKRYIRKIEVYGLGILKDVQVVQVLTREFIFSNDDNSEGKLLKQISYLFDELELSVNSDGSIINVLNKKSLIERWREIQHKLLMQNKGELIENYFIQITKLLENESELINFLEDYNMFGLLFNGLWNSKNQMRTKITKDGYKQIMIPEITEGKLIQKISIKDNEHTKIDYMNGINCYDQNTLEESYIEIKENNHHFKYSLLWVG